MSRKEWLLIIGFALAICLGGLSVWAHRRAQSPPQAVLEARAPTPEVRPAARETGEAGSPEKGKTVRMSPPAPLDQADNAADDAPATLTVSIAGAVRRPGVYLFDEGARVQDLLNAARGTVEEANLGDINLAARLLDGSTLHVPRKTLVKRADGGIVVRRQQRAAECNPAQYTLSAWRRGRARSVSNGHGAGDLGQDMGRSAAGEAQSGRFDLNQASQQDLESIPGIGPKLAGAILHYRQNNPFASVEDVLDVPGIGPKRLESIRPLVTVAPE